MHDNTRAPGAPSLDAAPTVHGELQSVGMGSCTGDCTGAGACSATRAAEGRDELERVWPTAKLYAQPVEGKLSHYTMKAVETSACAAARENRTPVDACPYPFMSLEGKHWMAVFLLAGGDLEWVK